MPVALTGKVNNKGTKDISSSGMSAKLALEVDDDYFNPTFIKAAPGAKVTIDIENEGSNSHTFTLDDGTVNKQIDPGKDATVTVTVPMSGSLKFHCNFHGSMGMQGAFFTGTGAASGSGSGSTTAPAAPTTTAASGGGSGY